MEARAAFVAMERLCQRHGAMPLGLYGKFEAELPGGRTIESVSLSPFNTTVKPHRITLVLSTTKRCSVLLSISANEAIYSWLAKPEGDDLIEFMMLV